MYVSRTTTPLVEYLLDIKKLVSNDGDLFNKRTGDWYMPLNERRGAERTRYFDYLSDGPKTASIAVALFCPGYRDDEWGAERYFFSYAPSGGHLWLNVLGQDGHRTATELNLADGEENCGPGSVLNSYLFLGKERDGDFQTRLAHRSRRAFGLAERAAGGRDGRDGDGNLRYPHSLVHVGATARAASALEIDAAAHKFMSGRGDAYAGARFSGFNLGGLNCAGYGFRYLQDAGIDMRRLGVKATSFSDAICPMSPRQAHRAAFRRAMLLDGAAIPGIPNVRAASVHPAALTRGSSADAIFLLDAGDEQSGVWSVGEVLRHAESLGVLARKAGCGTLISRLPPGLEPVRAQRSRPDGGAAARAVARASHLVSAASIALAWRYPEATGQYRRWVTEMTARADATDR